MVSFIGFRDRSRTQTSLKWELEVSPTLRAYVTDLAKPFVLGDHTVLQTLRRRSCKLQQELRHFSRMIATPLPRPRALSGHSIIRDRELCSSRFQRTRTSILEKVRD